MPAIPALPARQTPLCCLDSLITVSPAFAAQVMTAPLPAISCSRSSRESVGLGDERARRSRWNRRLGAFGAGASCCWQTAVATQTARAVHPCLQPEALTRLRHSPDPGATKDLVPRSVVELKTGSAINSLS